VTDLILLFRDSATKNARHKLTGVLFPTFCLLLRNRI